ncbi:MAG: hypothetical protein M1829_004114 [Trizodia sp. TS-e1964]|nr:MAG: hypothetical protein M1829_004114 [Trizodia sp. TS-e1964]
MAEDEYMATGGSLKLKGVKDSKIKKKKKKPSSSSSGFKPSLANSASVTSSENNTAQEQVARDEDEKAPPQPDLNEEDQRDLFAGKTEAERRHEEQKRKRLDERLMKEGIKSHKERVEDLNKYLSKLSEHHDMPRIGPG